MMDQRMATIAQRDEIIFDVAARMGAQLLVVNLKRLHAAT
jgi:hypothetical protein